MKRTLYRILLAALMADLVGTIILLLFAATFSGGANDDSVLAYAGLAAFIMAVGAVLALPTAALGVLLGDLIAPTAGVSRTIAFAAIGAGLGAFMGTPLVGGVSGFAGGIVGSYPRNSDPTVPVEEPSWRKLLLVASLVLLCALVYFAGIARLSFLD